MKSTLSALLAAISAAIFAIAASAQPAGPGPGRGPGPRQMDCAKAKDKARCEVHNAALAACKDKVTRAEHRKCMEAQLPAAAAKKN